MVSEVNIIQGQHHSNFALIHFYAQIIIILHITFSPRGKHDISNCIRFYTYYSTPNKTINYSKIYHDFIILIKHNKSLYKNLTFI